MPQQRLDLADASLLILWWVMGWQISFQAMPAPTVASHTLLITFLIGIQYGTMILWACPLAGQLPHTVQACARGLVLMVLALDRPVFLMSQLRDRTDHQLKSDVIKCIT